MGEQFWAYLYTYFFLLSRPVTIIQALLHFTGGLMSTGEAKIKTQHFSKVNNRKGSLKDEEGGKN